MKALLLRLRRQVGWAVAAFLLLPLAALAIFPPTNVLRSVGSSQLVSEGARVAFVALIIGYSFARYARGYRRSSTLPVLSTENFAAELPISGRSYCLVLRTFGRDGYVLLPRTNRRGRRRAYSSWNNPTVTAEEVMAAAAQEVLGLRTVGIVDQSVRLAPPGPVFRRVPDEQWQQIAARLIRRARVIVLSLGPDQDIGRGFAWEIEQIRGAGQATRVVIALPPPDQGREVHEEALQRACVLLTILNGTNAAGDVDAYAVGEAKDQLLPTATVIAHTPRIGVGSWGLRPIEPSGGAAMRVLLRAAAAVRSTTDKLYYSALKDAFAAVLRENYEDGLAPASAGTPAVTDSAPAAPGPAPGPAAGARNPVTRLLTRPGVATVLVGVVLLVAGALYLDNARPGSPTPPLPTADELPEITVVAPQDVRIESTVAFTRDGTESVSVRAEPRGCLPDLPICMRSLAPSIPVVVRLEGAARIDRPLSDDPPSPALKNLTATPTLSQVPVPDAPAGSPPADQYTATIGPLRGLTIDGYSVQPSVSNDKERHLFRSPPVMLGKCSDPAASSDVAALSRCTDFSAARTDAAPDTMHITLDRDEPTGNLRVDSAQPAVDGGPVADVGGAALDWTWVPHPRTATETSDPFRVTCNYVDIDAESSSGWSPAFFSGLLVGLGIAVAVVGVRRYRAARRPRSQYVVS